MKIVIIGGGGHSKVIKDIILSNKNLSIFGYLDDKHIDKRIHNGLFLGPISYANEIVRQQNDIRFVIAIGNNLLRKQIAQRLNLQDDMFITLIHSTAIVSCTCQIDVGTVIMPNTVINSDSIIGKHVIINTGAVVEHDNVIGDFVHVSPNATLTGSVKVGEGSHVGAGATVIPNVEIGEWSIIGAGATVIHDIPANKTAVGTPTKIINKKNEGGEISDFRLSST